MPHNVALGSALADVQSRFRALENDRGFIPLKLNRDHLATRIASVGKGPDGRFRYLYFKDQTLKFSMITRIFYDERLRLDMIRWRNIRYKMSPEPNKDKNR